MTLQALRYFIAAAQQRNFTRAAEQLFISQPALSKAIAELEAEMNCTLFIRGKRSVSLTPEGEALYHEAVFLLNRADALPIRIQRTNNLPPISVGYYIYGHLDIIRKKLEPLALNMPLGLEIEPIYDSSPSYIIEQLQKQTLDIAILTDMQLPDIPPHEKVFLQHCWVCAVVPRSSRFYDRNTLSLAELGQEKFILYHEEYSMLNQRLKEACLQAGFQMEIAGTANRVPEMICQASQKGAIGFCHSATGYAPPTDIHFIPIEDLANGFDLWAVRLTGVPNPRMDQLFALLRNVVS